MLNHVMLSIILLKILDSTSLVYFTINKKIAITHLGNTIETKPLHNLVAKILPDNISTNCHNCNILGVMDNLLKVTKIAMTHLILDQLFRV